MSKVLFNSQDARLSEMPFLKSFIYSIKRLSISYLRFKSVLLDPRGRSPGLTKLVLIL